MPLPSSLQTQAPAYRPLRAKQSTRAALPNESKKTNPTRSSAALHANSMQPSPPVVRVSLLQVLAGARRRQHHALELTVR
eukprot:CAMPEP_0202838222 /NCGR_PEP_ID=MMETSP1389-20130828/48626_1 /ASSEMBLY_ACC=CAM_ASM_000865 /TAXON_ID=302021 /ORGANISM="Rhodomonas sp., Strain CCMP768" /LENGTH=79 /DNA_ID=CAMNT_0049514447 /DNA_START=27 /DNA_END=263 /DNA_ORIENTATION=-